jgi:hypothetical protein
MDHLSLLAVGVLLVIAGVLFMVLRRRLAAFVTLMVSWADSYEHRLASAGLYMGAVVLFVGGCMVITAAMRFVIP